MNISVLKNPSNDIEEDYKANLVRRLARNRFNQPAVLLSCARSYRRLNPVNDITMANAFSQGWTCQPLDKIFVPTVALCHVQGVIKKIYKDLSWSRLSETNADTRWLSLRDKQRLLKGELWKFSGNEAPEYAHLLDLDLSEDLTQRGMANPVRYINCR